ncbi:hypothetical protein ACFSUS_26080 [Spirosoma soli]|uniref:Lipoprotein n=1 Tax=Spirosoma soli TaxID=1770529 RepID=A0ABW5MEZ9_9BACT
MLSRVHGLAALLSSLLLMAGCQSLTTEPSSPGYDYFPLETGRYTIYDVEENQYRLNSVPIPRTYQLKEVIGAVYSDVTNQPAYRLMRYRRPNATQPWQVDSIWTARLVNNEGIRTENGADFVKLIFPIDNQIRWNGNRLNTRGQDDYEMRNSGQPYRVSNKEFPETVTVVAQNDSTLIAQDKRIDVYARQVGMVYRERTQLQFCSSTPTCIGKYQIDYGIRQVYRINTYGKE